MKPEGKLWKLFSVWIAVSAVIVIAGIALMALLGFNTASDFPNNVTFEVEYNVSVKVDEEAQGKLETIIEDAFSKNGVKILDIEKGEGVNTTQDVTTIRYIADGKLPQEKLDAVKKAVDDAVATQILAGNEYAEVFAEWHTEEVQPMHEADWRGAVAIFVGVVVALIYVGVRFGVGSALTGLAVTVHDALFTVCLLAVCRIPVYAAAPIWYAAFAAALSLGFWLINCIKIRSLTKGPDAVSLNAEECVDETRRGVWKWIVFTAAAAAIALLLVGLVATAGVRALVLPALICVAAAVYSSLLFGPALHTHVKGAFDKIVRKKKTRYVGKPKATPTETEE